MLCFSASISIKTSYVNHLFCTRPEKSVTFCSQSTLQDNDPSSVISITVVFPLMYFFILFSDFFFCDFTSILILASENCFNVLVREQK